MLLKKAAKPAAKKVAAKPAAKKAAPKKAAKPAAKKVVAPKAVAKPSGPVKSRYSKSQIVQEIADITSVARKEVGKMLEHLEDIIARHLSPKGPGEFVLPGILKINAIKKPAKKARKGINPFTGEEVMFKAKPASTAVKVRPLKKLKEMAAK
ncbi:MAG: HU family DNA-binding protein [Cellvibrionales bacterium]|nr:HU family DNA-binding protein [Cellvibrionales bacterium]